MPDLEPGRVELPEGEPWTEDYLANTCHILERATGSASSMTPSPPALCGRRPPHPPHAIDDPLAFECPICGRPRCPECARRYRP